MEIVILIICILVSGFLSIYFTRSLVKDKENIPSIIEPFYIHIAITSLLAVGVSIGGLIGLLFIL